MLRAARSCRRLAPPLALLLLALPVAALPAQELEAPAPLRGNQSLAVPDGLPGAFQLGLILGGEYRVLDLRSHSVRAPEHRLYVADALGRLRPTAPAPPSTYRGEVVGRDGSRAAAWLSADGLHAVVLDGEDAWLVQPDPAAARDLHFVGSFRDLPLDGLACGSLGDALGDARARGSRGSSSSGAESSGPALAKIAYDADSVFLAKHGGDVQAAQAAAEGVIAQSSVIYEHFLDIQYEVSGAVIRTSANDPYIHTYGLSESSSSALWLSKFQLQWNTQSPEKDIPGNAVYLFSGHTGFGDGFVGRAYLGTVCKANSHYAVGAEFGQAYTRLILFSHELGHSWDACHCNQTGGCAGMEPDCGIMSSGIGGGSGTFFGAKATADIQAYKASVQCLGTGVPSPAPTLSSVAPAQVQVLDGGRLTLDGDDLDVGLFVHVGAETIDFRFITILDDQTIELLAPRGAFLGPEDVSVSGPGGTSAVQQFTYVETSPPKLVADFYPTTGFTAVWTYGGLVGKTGRVLLSFDSSTTTVGGFQVLANGNTADEQVLQDPGLATFSRAIPQQLLGSTLYLQVLLFDGADLIDVSAIESYLITG